MKLEQMRVFNEAMKLHSAEDVLIVCAHPNGAEKQCKTFAVGEELEFSYVVTEKGNYVIGITGYDNINNILALSDVLGYKRPDVSSRRAADFATFRMKRGFRYTLRSVKLPWWTYTITINNKD